MTPSERMTERWRKIKAGELPKPERGGDGSSSITRLTKPVTRETAARYCSRNLVLIIAPCGGQSEARVGLRLKGKRQQYVVTVSDLFRWAGEQHGYKERAAKRQARKAGIPWKVAKRKFIAVNSIP